MLFTPKIYLFRGFRVCTKKLWARDMKLGREIVASSRAFYKNVTERTEASWQSWGLGLA